MSVSVGLTGGIGAGKSTVASLLVGHGAILVDADLIARQVVEPHGPVYRDLVERFGPGILDPIGNLDRPALARIVFNDSSALSDLNAITHPAIGLEMLRHKEQAEASFASTSGGRGVVVMDIPLLRQEHRDNLDLAAVIVVDTPVPVAIDRLVRLRGLSPDDARARVESQVSREERCAAADFVVDNSGDHGALVGQVDQLWGALQSLDT